MNSLENIEARAAGRSPVAGLPPPAQPGLLYLVTDHELQALRSAGPGGLPVDLESKLVRLAGKGLIHRSVERNCRLFVALLLAANEGFFGEASREERERLLRVLAYVRKDDDAIPDYRRTALSTTSRRCAGPQRNWAACSLLQGVAAAPPGATLVGRPRDG